MRIEKLELRHRDILYERLKKLGTGISTLSFSNIYLFRKTHVHEIIYANNDEIFIRGRTYENLNYLIPTVNVVHLNKERLKELMKDVDFLFPIPEKWLSHFSADQFNFTYENRDSDYIYLTENMSTYRGSKLHKKRNLMKQFVTDYEHKMEPLLENKINDAISILDAWQKESKDKKHATDYYPCKEAIELNNELVLCGIIYYVRDEPAGFMLGEELTADMFDIKFAKAKIKFKGIYQYMFNHFANLLPKQYRYFNLEEDLGKESLKSAKSSYVPLDRLKKYRVSLIKRDGPFF